MSCAWASEGAKPPVETSPLIALNSLSMRSGHRTVIDKSSLTIDKGELVGLTGRSVSDKAAFINLISGQCFPSSGEIIFHSEDITHLPAEIRQLRGIARTFQAGSLFSELTALENVLLGDSIRPQPFFPRLGGAPYIKEAMTLLDFAGIPHIATELAGSLSPTSRCLLMIAVALANKPSLLILDEPAAETGVDLSKLTELLKRIRAEGIAALVTGRNGCPIMHSCDRVVALRKRSMILGAPSLRPARARSAAVSYRHWL